MKLNLKTIITIALFLISFVAKALETGIYRSLLQDGRIIDLTIENDSPQILSIKQVAPPFKQNIVKYILAPQGKINDTFEYGNLVVDKSTEDNGHFPLGLLIYYYEPSNYKNLLKVRNSHNDTYLFEKIK